MSPLYRDILMVEDDDTFARVVSRNLTSRGVSVRRARDAAEAGRQIRERRPDLLLLDINLPDRTGWDVRPAADDRVVGGPVERRAPLRIQAGGVPPQAVPARCPPAPRPRGTRGRGGLVMGIYILLGIVALTFLYLFYVLLRPERF
jgi:K+-transporting ATPase KdpF subunit